MSEIIYRKINENELNTEIFSNFNRYQQVNKCWRKREYSIYGTMGQGGV